jgi:NAD(P)-dependent dehydrogenase (short-subunit alcohol dehydrogenase family)
MLENKVAAVTGAGSGIGRAIAQLLATRGVKVAAIDINADTADETAQLITAAGGLASAYRADVSNSEDIDSVISALTRELGALDIMVNNAGVLDGYSDVDATDEALWRRVIEVDLTGVFLSCKRALREMLPRGYGRIINMASAAGLGGSGGGAAYVAAKHGVVGLTKQMAVTYAARGITVNCVCPGVIPTNFRANSQRLLGPDVPDMSMRGIAVNEDQVRALVPAGKRGSVDDIASAVCFLASDEAAYITGHSMVIDGGWRAR